MTGRYARRRPRRTRSPGGRAAAAQQVKPDALVVAEHAHDFRDDLQGGGWHGDDELRRVHATSLAVAPRRSARRAAQQLLGVPGRDADASTARQATATMRAFRAGVPWPSIAPLVGARRQPRQRTVGDRRRLARPPARRHRAADDDARRADGLRRRRGRARGRVGRGRAPDDAVGPAGDGDARSVRPLPRADRAAPRLGRARARRHPLRRGRRRRRSPTCASTADERLLCLAARSAHEPIRLAARRARRGGRRPCTATIVTVRRTARPCSPATAPRSTSGDWRTRMAEVGVPATVDKIYDNGVQAVFDLTMQAHRRRVPRPRRPVGLREDDGAAHGRGARGHLGRDDLDRRPRGQRPCRRASATSRWSSRTTRSTRTCRSRRTSRSGCGCARSRRA